MMTLVAVLGALAVGAPEIVEVVPAPLPLAATAEVSGSGFVAGATSVKIAEVAQRVILVEPERLRFLVALDTPLGPQTLTVTAQGESGGVVTSAVLVVPAVPQIQNVEPATLVLGGLGTVIGEGLATVTEVTLDGVVCEVSEQTDAVLVFAVPFQPELLGTVTLVLDSPSGEAHDEVVIAAPRPEIDALMPNPVRAGSLVTVRGRIAPIAPRVEIAAVEVPIVGVADGPSETVEITVWVPTTMAPRPYDVVVTSGGQSSLPAGPLQVDHPSAKAPEVSGIYPIRVAAGGAVWVAGQHLDGVEAAVGGLEVVSCEKRACRLTTAGLAIGQAVGALVGDEGAGVVQLEVIDEAPVVPVITGVEPSPAIRGEALAIVGRDLAGVRSVVLGGVAQSIVFVDADRVEVTVGADTPLGAEPLFVSGNAGSEALLVTVLDPLPLAEGGPEVVESGGEAEGAEVGEEVIEGVGSGGGDEGCAGGGAGSGSGLLVVIGGLWAGRCTRRTRARPAG